MDIGTAKPTVAERRCRETSSGRRRRSVGGVVGRPDAGARARRDRRHRGAREAGSARRWHRAVRARGRRRARDPRAGPRGTAAAHGCHRDSRRRGRRVRTTAIRGCRCRGAHRARQPPPHRARARSVRRDRPSFLVVRSCLRRVSAACARRADGRLLRREHDTRRADRGARRGRCAPPVCSTRRAASPRQPRGLSRTAAKAIGYAEMLAFDDGAIPELDDAFTQVVRRTRRFARRQRVWFRRDPRIQWMETEGKSEAVAAAILAAWQGPIPASV